MLYSFFLKFLDDQLPVDQIVECSKASFLDLIDQFLAGELLAQRLFARSGDFLHLRKSNDVSIHHSGDPVDNLRVCGPDLRNEKTDGE